MKDKKYKYLDDLLDDYFQLKDEQAGLEQQANKAREKHTALLADHKDPVIEQIDSQDVYKAYYQLKKAEEENKTLQQDFREVEELLKDFLDSLTEKKVSYERKDENKNKVKFLLWTEDGHLNFKEVE